MKLALQAIALRQYYPGSIIHLSTRGLAWQGAVVPTLTSRRYLIGFTTSNERVQPSVRVLEPHLEPDVRGRLPHVWDDGSLCLSARDEWNPRHLYVDTVIPWACEWLHFYEVWKATAIWMGDEIGAVEKDTKSVLYHFGTQAQGQKADGLHNSRKKTS